MTTTTSMLAPAIQQSLSYKLLSVPVPNMIYTIPAMLKRMPRNGGQTYRQRRYDPLKTAIVPLGNSGQMPPPQSLSAVSIDAQISFYGTYLKINEQVSLTNQDPVLNESAKLLGISLRQTEDELTRNMLQSTASSINCVGGTNGDNPTEITRSDVDTIIRTLADSDCQTISDVIEGEDRTGTSPVRDAYFGLASTKLIGDLEQVQGFISKSQYPNQDKTLKPEWGAISNLRFLLSSIGSKSENSSSAGNDVYDITCVGSEAYCVIEQDGYSAEFLYRPPIYSSALALNCEVGYKFGYASVITNDAWVVTLKTTLSN